MQNSTTNTLFFRLGKAMGQPLAWVLRKQRPVASWLTGMGLSVSFAKRLLTIVNLAILVGLLFAFVPTWVILLVIAFGILAYNNTEFDLRYPQKRYEQRAGTNGYGLYDNELGFRVDAGNIEDEN